jgi:dihydroflavonol-4-reductase
VRDVAAAHLLADRKGMPGERYLIGGRNFTLARLFADIARISGVPAPPMKVPLGPTMMAAAAGRRVGVPVPVTEDELRSAAQWWTYRCTKAKKELGFKPRPHEETLEDAVNWQVERLGDRVGRAPRGDLPMRAVGHALRLVDRVGFG